jgi:hypothetical protein
MSWYGASFCTSSKWPMNWNVSWVILLCLQPCRYGRYCGRKLECSFLHEDIPSADKLKWFCPFKLWSSVCQFCYIGKQMHRRNKECGCEMELWTEHSSLLSARYGLQPFLCPFVLSVLPLRDKRTDTLLLEWVSCWTNVTICRCVSVGNPKALRSAQHNFGGSSSCVHEHTHSNGNRYISIMLTSRRCAP